MKLGYITRILPQDKNPCNDLIRVQKGENAIICGIGVRCKKIIHAMVS